MTQHILNKLLHSAHNSDIIISLLYHIPHLPNKPPKDITIPTKMELLSQSIKRINLILR